MDNHHQIHTNSNSTIGTSQATSNVTVIASGSTAFPPSIESVNTNSLISPNLSNNGDSQYNIDSNYSQYSCSSGKVACHGSVCSLSLSGEKNFNLGNVGGPGPESLRSRISSKATSVVTTAGIIDQQQQYQTDFIDQIENVQVGPTILDLQQQQGQSQTDWENQNMIQPSAKVESPSSNLNMNLMNQNLSVQGTAITLQQQSQSEIESSTQVKIESDIMNQEDQEVGLQLQQTQSYNENNSFNLHDKNVHGVLDNDSSREIDYSYENDNDDLGGAENQSDDDDSTYSTSTSEDGAFNNLDPNKSTSCSEEIELGQDRLQMGDQQDVNEFQNQQDQIQQGNSNQEQQNLNQNPNGINQMQNNIPTSSSSSSSSSSAVPIIDQQQQGTTTNSVPSLPVSHTNSSRSSRKMPNLTFSGGLLHKQKKRVSKRKLLTNLSVSNTSNNVDTVTGLSNSQPDSQMTSAGRQSSNNLLLNRTSSNEHVSRNHRRNKRLNGNHHHHHHHSSNRFGNSHRSKNLNLLPKRQERRLSVLRSDADQLNLNNGSGKGGILSKSSVQDAQQFTRSSLSMGGPGTTVNGNLSNEEQRQTDSQQQLYPPENDDDSINDDITLQSQNQNLLGPQLLEDLNSQSLSQQSQSSLNLNTNFKENQLLRKSVGGIGTSHRRGGYGRRASKEKSSAAPTGIQNDSNSDDNDYGIDTDSCGKFAGKGVTNTTVTSLSNYKLINYHGPRPTPDLNHANGFSSDDADGGGAGSGGQNVNQETKKIFGSSTSSSGFNGGISSSIMSSSLKKSPMFGSNTSCILPILKASPGKNTMTNETKTTIVQPPNSNDINSNQNNSFRTSVSFGAKDRQLFQTSTQTKNLQQSLNLKRRDNHSSSNIMGTQSQVTVTSYDDINIKSSQQNTSSSSSKFGSTASVTGAGRMNLRRSKTHNSHVTIEYNQDEDSDSQNGRGNEGGGGGGGGGHSRRKTSSNIINQNDSIDFNNNLNKRSNPNSNNPNQFDNNVNDTNMSQSSINSCSSFATSNSCSSGYGLEIPGLKRMRFLKTSKSMEGTGQSGSGPGLPNKMNLSQQYDDQYSQPKAFQFNDTTVGKNSNSKEKDNQETVTETTNLLGDRMLRNSDLLLIKNGNLGEKRHRNGNDSFDLTSFYADDYRNRKASDDPEINLDFQNLQNDNIDIHDSSSSSSNLVATVSTNSGSTVDSRGSTLLPFKTTSFFRDCVSSLNNTTTTSTGLVQTSTSSSSNIVTKSKSENSTLTQSASASINNIKSSTDSVSNTAGGGTYSLNPRTALENLAKLRKTLNDNINVNVVTGPGPGAKNGTGPVVLSLCDMIPETGLERSSNGGVRQLQSHRLSSSNFNKFIHNMNCSKNVGNTNNNSQQQQKLSPRLKRQRKCRLSTDSNFSNVANFDSQESNPEIRITNSDTTITNNNLTLEDAIALHNNKMNCSSYKMDSHRKTLDHHHSTLNGIGFGGPGGFIPFQTFQQQHLTSMTISGYQTPRFKPTRLLTGTPPLHQHKETDRIFKCDSSDYDANDDHQYDTGHDINCHDQCCDHSNINDENLNVNIDTNINNENAQADNRVRVRTTSNLSNLGEYNIQNVDLVDQNLNDDEPEEELSDQCSSGPCGDYHSDLDDVQNQGHNGPTDNTIFQNSTNLLSKGPGPGPDNAVTTNNNLLINNHCQNDTSLLNDSTSNNFGSSACGPSSCCGNSEPNSEDNKSFSVGPGPGSFNNNYNNSNFTGLFTEGEHGKRGLSKSNCPNSKESVESEVQAVAETIADNHVTQGNGINDSETVVSH